MEKPTLDPYAAPRADIEAPPNLEGQGPLTAAEVEAFVGKNSPYYWKKWQKAQGLSAGFNWLAGFFNLNWMLYRRMYREFFIALGIVVAFGTVVGLLEAFLPSAKDVLDIVNRGVNIAWVVGFGFLANGLYLKRAKEAVARSRMFASEEERLAYLATQGGIRMLWVYIVVAVVAVVMLGSVLLGALTRISR
jgi:hypothetical protein